MATSPTAYANFKCPDCGASRVYDNRADKRNPDAPDFVCTEKRTCGWREWPNGTTRCDHKHEAPVRSATERGKDGPVARPQANASTPASARARNRRPRYVAAIAFSALKASSASIAKVLGAEAAANPDIVIRWAATIFIEASRSGNPIMPRIVADGDASADGSDLPDSANDDAEEAPAVHEAGPVPDEPTPSVPTDPEPVGPGTGEPDDEDDDSIPF